MHFPKDGDTSVLEQFKGRTDMAWIKARDIAYGRLRAPDLDVMEEFLTRFGLMRVERTSQALYMRGSDPPHHIHITEKGEPRFVGLAYYAQSEDDLRQLAKAPGASAVETIDEPGGGKRVRLTEPNGYQIEVVHGIATLAPLQFKPRQKINTGDEPLSRAGDLMRLPKGPSQVKRIGHGVLGTPKVHETVQWFRDMLGFICSDDVYAGEKDNLIGSFNRCDCGDDYVDHHVFFALAHEKAGLNHLSFEVPDIDDVFMGHQYLRQFGRYEHMWGIGRHLLGSQVYDYWADPWGRVHEHWADSDRLNVANGSNTVPVEEALVSQWGEPPPDRFVNHVSP
jgi:catechol 2,3-dioxygenase-like lactoylglutathione lyase family enzyme